MSGLQTACASAEQAVRELIQLTRPAITDLACPAEAGEVIAALAAVTGMLPQLLDQLTRWLLTQHDTVRLRLDSISEATGSDTRETVHAAAAALEHASQCLHRAAHQLDAAHQHVAHLAVSDSGCAR